MKTDDKHPEHQGHIRLLRGLAWVVGLLEIIVTLITLFFVLSGEPTSGTDWGFRGFPSIFALLISIISLVILHHHPTHAVGWVFCALGLMGGAQGALFEYAAYALIEHPGSLPGGIVAAWLESWIWMIGFVLLDLLLLLFPNGHLPSPRWRILVWAVFGIIFPMIVLIALIPGSLGDSFANLDNPYGVMQLGGFFAEISIFLFFGAAIPLFFISLLGLIQRMFRSQGYERQQFKWFVFAGALLVVTFPAAAASSLLIQSFYMAAMLFLPVAMGIAIMRYRLYDIDLIIRRTLTYSIITALLALIYFGGVIVLQNLFVTLTGQTQSQLVTVISTLTIAALFFPLRNRVQIFIDRRFYRQKYDTAKTLAEFASAVRDEVELEKLSERLVRVIDETMQPQTITLQLHSARSGTQNTAEGQNRFS
jgi:hypothetical protein